ncbi:alpha/beta fold hydrolase [Nocardioides eburneiflavus]|uniref:Alpha/beta fold hydrolase n=1 Tax=Nocardioides eburneiflavus TaxID=2518372 RepID=A0A4Z1CLZ7_9ACTN|nr:alpha/beta fold hydrolase [Nocardioides eburneiflavus]
MDRNQHWHAYEWEGREIAWRRLGEGPPVVMCHGTPWSSVVWEDVAGALAATRTVYLWDMPGYGRSSKAPHHRVDLDVQGRALTALVDEWGLAAPDVVAHDFGGAVALRAHLLHDVPVRSLALADIVLLQPWGSDFFNLVRDHSDVFSRLPAGLHRALLETYIQGACHQRLDPQVLGSLSEPWLSDEGQSAFYAQIAQADCRFTDEVVERLDSIAVPTLVLWGERDAWLPVEQAHRLHRLIPSSRCRTIPDAGHLVQYDAPQELAGHLLAWLAARSVPHAPGRQGFAQLVGAPEGAYEQGHDESAGAGLQAAGALGVAHLCGELDDQRYAADGEAEQQAHPDGVDADDAQGPAQGDDDVDEVGGAGGQRDEVGQQDQGEDDADEDGGAGPPDDEELEDRERDEHPQQGPQHVGDHACRDPAEGVEGQDGHERRRGLGGCVDPDRPGTGDGERTELGPGGQPVQRRGPREVEPERPDRRGHAISSR